MEVSFELLGEVRVLVDGVAVDLGHARQRCVLAALLVDHNQPQSLDSLTEKVWGDRAPRQARSTLYGYLFRLRQVLGGVPGAVIGRTAAGYVLPVDAGTVDLERFRALVERSRSGDDDEALALVERALGLWRGEALGGISGGWADAVRQGLDRERWSAVAHRNDIALRLGRHESLLAELSTLVKRDPLDERLAAQFMLALHRSGRPAEAMAHYQVIRRALADELGTDPGPRLRELYQQMLVGEVAPPAVGRPPTPRQLPAPPRLFVGRDDELVVLDGALARQGGSLAVVGAGGSGKTALALHWAHRALDRFPDGQLYADLRGFDPTGPPTSTSAVLLGFLGALGATSLPADVDGQAALYRSLVAGRRLLVVLDNARDTDQVLALLPGGTTCTTLITSRHRLTALTASRGVPTLALDVLPDDDARALLSGHLSPQRVSAEPEAVATLLGHCAGLPLAIGIVAARAAAHPGFPLAAFADELGEADGLDGLDTAELSTSLRAVFAASLRALSADAARLFALLGIAPGPDIGLPAVAALADVPVPRARSLLEELETGHLVRQHVPGRYRMHDLVRLCAAERARDEETALGRVIDFYVRSGLAAERALYPHETPAAVFSDQPGPADDGTALAWLVTEYTCLIAAQEAAVRAGDHPAVWRLAWALDTFQRRQGHLHRDQITVWRAGLAAADRAGDLDARALASWRLGAALARAGDVDEASRHLHRALTLSREAGDPSGEAAVHQSLAWVRETQGDDRQALHHAVSALDVLGTLDRPIRHAHALNQAGWYAARLNDLDQARHYCEAALSLARAHADRDAEARTLDSLGYIAHRAGHHDKAVAHYELALTHFEDVGATYDYADTVERLADAHAAAGRPDRAREHRLRALALFLQQHRTADADRVALTVEADARKRGNPRRGS
ncbi:AfsR/SARP family transcriptional regulator [Saccharothrix syringae]|uniref:Tetratricopeptide repeat protein n=1 Tax=Saccharothrix syringae TaxID=103733 RepID=A0A5Q0GZ28_SACSY|nr:BTAD domain-containing putative transcriptional regulator [Saccharothrix syringae]QFZ18784.1 tetratricopeptide repeat protein [Saccharothrix syringae]